MTYDAIETAPREALEALQLERLRATVGRILDAVPAGRARLHDAGVRSAQDIRSLDDLSGLPFTWKSDLREHYPFGLLAVPREQLVRVHASSGTGGKPTVVGYTRHDLDDVWTAVMARAMAGAGVRAGMVVHNAYGYGLFTGGLGLPPGRGAARGDGRADLGRADRPPGDAAAGLRRAGAVLDAVLRAEHRARPAGDRRGARRAEAGDRAVRRRAVERGDARADRARARADRDATSTASRRSSARASRPSAGSADGLHVNEDHFLVEVVDPDAGTPCAPGQEGELVFTTLTKEALPLLRYRTADIAALSLDACPCGRTLARMSPVRGRSDDMLIIRGVNLYPSEIEHTLLAIDGVAPHYQLVVDRPGDLDELTVHCEPLEDGIDRDRAARPHRPRAARGHRPQHRRRAHDLRRGPAQRGQGGPRGRPPPRLSCPTSNTAPP